MKQRSWKDISLEWLIVIVGVAGISPFILTAVFTVGCYMLGYSNSCTILGWYQDVN